MKHLISLSMKYIRRQKMRTFLTFMCITLSAFILISVCGYASSLFTTLKNTTIKEDGAWELDVTNWIEESADRKKAADTIMNHAVVDDYFYKNNESILISMFSDNDTNLKCFEISDKAGSYRSDYILMSKDSGNDKLIGIYEKNNSRAGIPESNPDGAVLPGYFKERGYSVGDTITLKISPLYADFDEDSQIIKDIRDELKEEYGTRYTTHDKEYKDLPAEKKEKACKSSIGMLLNKKGYTYNEYPLTDISYGKPLEITMKIADFEDNSPKDSLFFSLPVNDDFSFSEYASQNGDLRYYASMQMKIRTIDSYNYEDAVKMLFTDLGFNYDTEYYSYEPAENNMLLALEWKSANAIASQVAPMLAPLAVFLLIAWLISRFVIDNAFEMAVQERSTHFAALRIMGASKAQIAALVFTEAAFYSLTAVPLGVIAAVLVVKSCFRSLQKSGLSEFEFSAMPEFLITGIALCLIALFISSYTSAMWATRKLSPAEALNFGKPKRKKNRKIRRKKSRLNLSSGQFLRRYTRKNIKTSKSRFIVSTITMGLGVLMFTYTVLLGNIFRIAIKDTIGADVSDFRIEFIERGSDPKAPLKEANEYFGNKEIFSDYLIMGGYSTNADTNDGSDQRIKKLILNKKSTSPDISIIIMNENTYKKSNLDSITGMSYDENLKKDGFIFNNCCYDEFVYWKDEKEPPRLFDDGYTEFRNSINISLENGISFEFNIIGSSVSKASTSIIIPAEKAFDYNMSPSIDLRVNGRKNYAEAERLINEFAEKYSSDPVINNYTFGSGFIDLIKAIGKILASQIISVWLVGILSMINSVNTSVLNRSRELMMLRSVGMTKKHLRNSVMLETLMFSATAALTGTFVGVATFILIAYSDIKNEGWQLLSAVPVTVIASITLCVLISIVSAIPAIKSLSRVETIAQAANN